MLRINLLPVRQLKKRANARNQIIAFSMIFAGILVVLGFVAMYQISRVETVQAAIAELNREKQRLAPIIAEVDRLEKEQKDLRNKIDIINKLRKESSLTVHILDEVANLIDNTRIWITTFTQQGSSLQLKGVALDNQTVALLMETLKTSDYISNVSLSSSTLTKIQNRDFKTFGLSCTVGFPVEETDQSKAGLKQ